MTSADFDSLTKDTRLPVEPSEESLTASERFIRGVLLAGFIIVLGIEAYLIWEGWQLL